MRSRICKQLNKKDTSVSDESQPNMAPYIVEDFFTDVLTRKVSGAQALREAQPQEEAGGCDGVYVGGDDQDT